MMWKNPKLQPTYEHGKSREKYTAYAITQLTWCVAWLRWNYLLLPHTIKLFSTYTLMLTWIVYNRFFRFFLIFFQAIIVPMLTFAISFVTQFFFSASHCYWCLLLGQMPPMPSTTIHSTFHRMLLADFPFSFLFSLCMVLVRCMHYPSLWSHNIFYPQNITKSFELLQTSDSFIHEFLL